MILDNITVIVDPTVIDCPTDAGLAVFSASGDGNDVCPILPTPTATVTPTSIPDPLLFYALCTLTEGINIRREPTLQPFTSTGDLNVVGSLLPGSSITVDSLNTTEVSVTYATRDSDNNLIATEVRTVQFLMSTSAEGEARYIAQSDGRVRSDGNNIFSVLLTNDFSQSGCPQPPLPPSIDPTDPNRRTYYQRYDGLMFWILYHELSEDSFVDQFAIIDAHPEASNATRPHPDFYLTEGLPRISGGFDSALTNDIDVNGLDRRDHRYLYARMVISNMPVFTTNDFLGADGRTGLYDTGFRYALRWGDSIGNPRNLFLWNNSAGCGISIPTLLSNPVSYPTYQSAFDTADGYTRITWLRQYALCSAQNPDDLIFNADFRNLISFVQLAIEDEIADLPNPVALDATTIGSGQAKKANTCYFDPESSLGCSETILANIQAFCQTLGSNCRDADFPYWGSFQNSLPTTVTVTNWLSGIDWGSNFNVLRPTDGPTYLFPAKAAATQIVYRTIIGYDYFVTVGLYGASPGRFMLMGLGMQQILNDTFANAFDRHWNRLNYGGNFLPQTFRPDGCINGLAHVLRVEEATETWITLAFQVADETDDNNWFCQQKEG